MGVAMFRNAAHQSIKSLLLHVSVVLGINIWVVRSGFGWVLQCFVTPHTDLLKLLLHVSVVWGINIWVRQRPRMGVAMFRNAAHDLLRACYYMYLWCGDQHLSPFSQIYGLSPCL